MFDIIKEILIADNEFSEINYIRLQGDMVHIKRNLIDTDGGTYLTVDSLIEQNYILTCPNNITLRKLM